MPLTPAQRQQLLGFIGFGAPERMRYVFIGEKEYTPADTQLENCEIRAASFKFPWEDKNEALRHLARGFASRGQPKVAKYPSGEGRMVRRARVADHRRSHVRP